MKISEIIDAFGYVIYAALALLAVWGVYNAILLYRNLAKKSLADATPLVQHVHEMAKAGKVKAIGVAWGYHAVADLRDAGADVVLQDFAELDAAIDDLVGAAHA